MVRGFGGRLIFAAVIVLSDSNDMVMAAIETAGDLYSENLIAHGRGAPPIRRVDGPVIRAISASRRHGFASPLIPRCPQLPRLLSWSALRSNTRRESAALS